MHHRAVPTTPYIQSGVPPRITPPSVFRHSGRTSREHLPRSQALALSSKTTSPDKVIQSHLSHKGGITAMHDRSTDKKNPLTGSEPCVARQLRRLLFAQLACGLSLTRGIQTATPGSRVGLMLRCNGTSIQRTPRHATPHAYKKREKRTENDISSPFTSTPAPCNTRSNSKGPGYITRRGWCPHVPLQADSGAT